jgi:hypothetical protein
VALLSSSRPRGRLVHEAGRTVEVARSKTYEHVDLLEISNRENSDLRPDERPLYRRRLQDCAARGVLREPGGLAW